MNAVETKSAVADFLASISVNFSARAMGETRRDDWTCDAWRVTFKNQKHSIETDYFTGIGHRVKPQTVHYAHGTKPYAIAPNAADVLHSLLLDGEACNESFNDWCANYGYSNDSLKAINTYQQCCKIGEDLRKLFSPDQLKQLRDLLQDY